jgi:hypothetical protein
LQFSWPYDGFPLFAHGSVPEVMDEGVTGFVVDNLDDAVKAVDRARSPDRRACRAVFEQRFSAHRVCRDYLRIYRQLRIGESMTVASSPFAPRKPRTFAERKATLIDSPILSKKGRRAARPRSPVAWPDDQPVAGSKEPG